MLKKTIVYIAFMLSVFLDGGQSSHAEDHLNHSEPEYIVSEFVSNLKGIEYYFMMETIEDKALSLRKMKTLLDYHKEEVPHKLSVALANAEGGAYNFAISKINRKAGYMRLYSTEAEISVTKTYWNIDEKRRLLATLVSSCTMVCEQNSLNFTLINNGRVSEKNYPVDIPELLYKPEYFLKDRSNTKPYSQDAVGVKVALPEKGLDILFELNGDPRFDDRDLFRGNCVKLAWDKKRANFNVMPPEFCQRQ